MTLGPNQYRVASRYALGRGGADTAQSDVLEQANKFCEKKGKESQVTDEKRVSDTRFEATFVCHDK